MKVLTWNVLHRVHAERFSEPAIEAWPSEARRVQALADRLFTAMTIESVDVALLQEVSGDVLSAVRARLPRHAVLNHAYPRVPRPQSRSLEDCTEHLVVIGPPGARLARSHTFSSDPGKGYVLVALPDGAHVASTHVSWGPKGAAQLATLAALFDEVSPLCVGGDFNCARELIDVRGVTFAVPAEGSPKTRADAKGGEDIDHLLCSGAAFHDVRVLEHDTLSDHRPLVATLRWLAR